MDDFGILARDLGYRPRANRLQWLDRTAEIAEIGRRRRYCSTMYSVVLQNTRVRTTVRSTSSLSDFDYDSIFKRSSASASDSKSRSSSPVYDKPVYDEDIFDGLPGLKSKSTSASVRFDEDMFASISSPPKRNQKQSAPFDDLLGNLGRTEKSEPKNNKSARGLDDLLPGFGNTGNRPLSESGRAQKTTVNSTQPTSDVMEDPFAAFESKSTPAVSSPRLIKDPLEEISKLANSGNTKVSGSSVSEGAFDDLDPLNGFGKSVPAFSSEINNRVKDGSPSRTGPSMSRAQTSVGTEPIGRSSFRDSGRHSQKMFGDNYQESHETVFDMPSVSTDSHKFVGQTASASYVNTKSSVTNSHVDVSPVSDGRMEPSDNVWITVSEIPLFTQPTSAPPPLRPPPPIPARASKSGAGFFYFKCKKEGKVVSQIDELEDFATGGTKNNVDEYADIQYGEEVKSNSSAAASAAAMKEAMDRAEAKFRHAKEEREYSENQERFDRERQLREEQDNELRKLEKEKATEIEREREKARQAVGRATREARERAAAEARERAAAGTRLKAERAAVERAQAEARERAGRAAVQRVQAEARERAAAEARERAEKAAADARERADAEEREKEVREKAAAAEARRRAERTAVERVAAEARKRAAAAARANQQKRMIMISNPFSAWVLDQAVHQGREKLQEPMPDPRFQSKGGPDGARRMSSVGASSNMRKASSTTNIVDDLTSIFGGAPSAGEFQEVEGESEERRRARLERQQRTQERTAKALAEKNQRDLQTQRDQEERHRIAETLDVEIKRWAAGKEGNLRALLSTMQYVLWPECGWQPVSLTDLITGASVKKFYRKATLCIHPDKVQQKRRLGTSLIQRSSFEFCHDSFTATESVLFIAGTNFMAVPADTFCISAAAAHRLCIMRVMKISTRCFGGSRSLPFHRASFLAAGGVRTTNQVRLARVPDLGQALSSSHVTGSQPLSIFLFSFYTRSPLL
ncbi:chaperone DnaJ-domain superfamily protein [Actinidia rufa]|uniref:Chaperone DnaJ-domain superfamily protein n=1 Tax=Actinidia rufa TaxID=165716 RepID=A0A7J0FL71_9ERIC|nr:chaperone DnaJ-domain superfamily protein [Actinidia rufa]